MVRTVAFNKEEEAKYTQAAETLVLQKKKKSKQLKLTEEKVIKRTDSTDLPRLVNIQLI